MNLFRYLKSKGLVFRVYKVSVPKMNFVGVSNQEATRANLQAHYCLVRSLGPAFVLGFMA